MGSDVKQFRMAPLLLRSPLPPPPLRDSSLDQPLLSPAFISRAIPHHRGKDRSEHRCNKWKRRICRTCCFWRCKPHSRDYDQSPPPAPEPRRRDATQPRNEAVLDRLTGTLRKRRNGPRKAGRTTGSGPQQPPATSPTRTVRFILTPSLLRPSELIKLRIYANSSCYRTAGYGPSGSMRQVGWLHFRIMSTSIRSTSPEPTYVSIP